MTKHLWLILCIILSAGCISNADRFHKWADDSWSYTKTTYIHSLDTPAQTMTTRIDCPKKVKLEKIHSTRIKCSKTEWDSSGKAFIEIIAYPLAFGLAVPHIGGGTTATATSGSTVTTAPPAMPMNGGWMD